MGLYGVVLRVQTPKMNALLLYKTKTVAKYDQIQYKSPLLSVKAPQKTFLARSMIIMRLYHIPRAVK